MELGVPFRTAHHRVGSLSNTAKSKTLALNAAGFKEMQITIPEATAEFLTLFDPESKAVGKRNIIGATGYEQGPNKSVFWQGKLQ